eukprot:625934-Amphidinium_carterae.1
MPVERVAKLERSQWEQLLEASPPLATVRANIVISGKPARSLTMGACTSRGPRIAAATKDKSAVLKLAHDLARERPTAEKSNNVLQIGENGEHLSRPGRWFMFDAECQHRVPPFEGSRFSIVYYTPRFPEKLLPYLSDLEQFGFPVKEWSRWFSCNHPALCWASLQPLGSTCKVNELSNELGKESDQRSQGMGADTSWGRQRTSWFVFGAAAVGTGLYQGTSTMAEHSIAEQERGCLKSDDAGGVRASQHSNEEEGQRKTPMVAMQSVP